MAEEKDIELSDEGFPDEPEKKADEPRIISKEIEDEMKQSYLDYAMSVIVGRALPDVRDGLKPVHRRVLYTMYKIGLTHNKPFKKSANVVGNCMAKYHPHGDSSIYDTLVRMAQPFSLRYPLVDGQGNFGSIDGDSAAAMRYTEARMQSLTDELMADIDKETVDYVDNFDNSSKEPTVLPSKIPNLLINGSSGIAVGMATNIPPHNMQEICGAVSAVIDDPEISIEGLFSYVKAPDFPTGGIILGTSGVKQAYLTGRGKIIVRARYHTEKNKNRESIIITEIPYMLNKSILLENMADLVRDKRIEGISDIRDESDRTGMRVVIELKAAANPEIVMNQLYKHTRLQDTFGIIMLSLVQNQPKTLNLKEMIEAFISHRKEVIIRRTEFDLAAAKEKEHILAGLMIALIHIDDIIEGIKKSRDAAEASVMLQKRFSLSEKQAKAILEMRLQRLSSLEQDKIKSDHKETLRVIEGLQGILNDPKKVMEIIKEDLKLISSKYGDKRRTDIDETGDVDIDIEDMLTPEDMMVAITHGGYIKRMPLDTYREQKRGGKGSKATSTKEEDFVEEIFVANTHDYLMFFSNKGRVHWLKVYRLPMCTKNAKGTPIVNLIDLDSSERISTILPVKKFEGYSLVMCTNKGIIKRVDATLFDKPRKGGVIAINLDEGAELIKAKLTDRNQEIIIATSEGMAVRFHEEDIRHVGRTAKGVRAIRLKGKDEVIGMVVARPGRSILTVTENGYGKRTDLEEYRLIRRGGSGVRNIICSPRNGKVVSVKAVNSDDSLIIISQNAIAIRIRVSDMNVIGRNTQGVRLIKLGEKDKVVAVAKVVDDEVLGDNS